ncbi:hypothetical protein ACFOZ7_03565 [Natribaculum luteum]|uniref:Uncharacterized protein n=1 Tax=Natribaculum luteum TaxID=1586232 RepID=A0ABD5NWA2_9EURY|nr:hypothetical protein [Natribaculum luteum]
MGCAERELVGLVLERDPLLFVALAYVVRADVDRTREAIRRVVGEFNRLVDVRATSESSTVTSYWDSSMVSSISRDVLIGEIYNISYIVDYRNSTPYTALPRA